MAPARSTLPVYRFTGWTAHLGGLGLAVLLLVLAFPPVGWGWAAHAALAPLALVAIGSDRRHRLYWSAWASGFLGWAWMIHWIGAVTTGGWLALAAWQGLYVLAAVWAIRRLARGRRWPLAAVVPMVWVSLELVRGAWPAGGFGWFSLAHSQAPWRAGEAAGRLVQAADLFGEPAVSFLVAASGGTLADVLLTCGRRRVGRRRLEGRRRLKHRLRAWGPPVAWGLLLALAWQYGERRLRASPEALEAPARVAVVQTNRRQDNTAPLTPDESEAAWDQLLLLTRRAAEAAPDLVVWPETVVPAALNAEARTFYARAGSGWRGQARYHEAILTLVRREHMNLLLGAHAWLAFESVALPDGSRRQLPARQRNAAYLYTPDRAEPRARYDKIHRVPFGEYLPWIEHWPWLKRQVIAWVSPWGTDYTIEAGKGPVILPVPVGWNRAMAVASPICFEDTVPRLVRRMMYAPDGTKRADLLVNLTNDGWFAGTAEGTQHQQIAVLRAIENRVPVARSVNTGPSGFIDSSGRIGPLVRAGGRHEDLSGVAVHEVRPDRRRTLFGRWGMTPAWCLAAFTALMLLIARPRVPK